MRVKLLTTISFFTYQISVSQNEKLLQGKVLSQNLPLNKVEVINKTAKISTTTNELGEFSILVKAQDSLLFFSKDYYFTRLKITAKEIETNNLIVKMIPKVEELNEVVILDKKTTSIKLSKAEILNIKLNSHKPKPTIKIEGYHEVKPNPLSADFVYLGKLIYYLLIKEDEEPKLKIKKIEFVELIRNTIDPDFFDKNLELKPEEKELFLQFCDADSQSKIISENPNILSITDFLNAKNEEFKKLKTEIKN